MMHIFWLVIFVVFLVVEMATVNLVSIWFAVGSLAALAGCALNAPVWFQVILFFVVSGVVLALLRPFARRYMNVIKKPTNADRVIGMVCQVTEDIDNIAGTGAVLVAGKVWSARSADGRKLPVGTYVSPMFIQGVKLIVEPVDVSEITTV